MNFFESEMRKMFGATDLVTDKKFTGRTMLAKLDDEKLLKLQFVTTGYADHYTAILVSIIGKNEGVVDKQLIRFSDVVGMYRRPNSHSDIEPHIWEDNGRPSWYTPLTNAQKQAIADAVLDYAGMFQNTECSFGMQL